MPFYDYHCPQCLIVFERLVSYDKADEVTCPSCEHSYAKRRLSKIAILKTGEKGSWSDGSCTTSTESVSS